MPAREIEIEKEMLEPRGGLWSSGSVTDEWNNQRSVVVVAVAVVVAVVVVVRWWW